MPADAVVAEPTYMADIRHLFRPMDIEHMRSKGIELGTYDGVRENAVTIYFHTAPPNASMPPADFGPQWTAEMAQTFKNWINSGCPLGTPTPAEPDPTPAPGTVRLRKDVTTLSEAEVAQLAKAFEGLMARDPDAPDSYYAIAGVHGLPGAHCLHHEGRFNPWHRVYLKTFEDALRSVPGCEEVTMPYWDFGTELPGVLQQPPFASYALPKDPGLEKFPYTTQRNTPADITKNMGANDVPKDVALSLIQSMWGTYNDGGYQSFSMQAHDGGHDAIGPTMADQDVASYDPVFWFFHCNIDRLWLTWQTRVRATDETGFMSTLTGDTTWFTSPLWNGLPPYATATPETIAFGIGYDKLATVPDPALENAFGSLDAERSFTIKSTRPVSVRVKGINRLDIPGTFRVHLLADGERIASRAFFQPKAPRDCATCAKHGLVNIDFRLALEEIVDRKLSVEIEVPRHEEMGKRFPLSQAGSPTINARLLLTDE